MSEMVLVALIAAGETILGVAHRRIVGRCKTQEVA